MRLKNPPDNYSIQWSILRQNYLATVASIISIITTLLLSSLFISSFTSWQSAIESNLGFSFFSLTYFIILSIVLFLGLIFAAFYSFFIVYPYGRRLKKDLYVITDGAEAFSRGRLDHRIKIEGTYELAMISKDFNNMADTIEKQVKSLQKLVDENVKLVNQTKATAAIDERRSLARELHDAVSQELFAISMLISAMNNLIDSDPAKAKENFKRLEEMVINAQQELRALIMHLRPVTLDGSSLVVGLNRLLAELEQKQPQIKWEYAIAEIELSQGIEDQLFRVVQEVISNMLRHSKATKFQLKLINKQDRIILLMEDNGVGFDLTDKRTSSYGLSNIKERIDDLGGRLDIYTYKEMGSRIEVRVPLKYLE